MLVATGVGPSRWQATFQGIESAIFLALAALLVFAATLVVRRLSV